MKGVLGILHDILNFLKKRTEQISSRLKFSPTILPAWFNNLWIFVWSHFLKLQYQERQPYRIVPYSRRLRCRRVLEWSYQHGKIWVSSGSEVFHDLFSKHVCFVLPNLASQFSFSLITTPRYLYFETISMTKFWRITGLISFSNIVPFPIWSNTNSFVIFSLSIR